MNFKDIDQLSHDILTQKKGLTGGRAIYQQNYLGGLINILQKKYPTVQRALGEKNFLFFCRNFILQTPSRSPNIDDYGLELAYFLSQAPELKNLPSLPHLAQLDLMLFRAHSSPPPIILPLGTLGLWESINQGPEGPSPPVSENQKERITLHQGPGGPMFQGDPL